MKMIVKKLSMYDPATGSKRYDDVVMVIEMSDVAAASTMLIPRVGDTMSEAGGEWDGTVAEVAWCYDADANNALVEIEIYLD